MLDLYWRRWGRNRHKAVATADEANRLTLKLHRKGVEKVTVVGRETQSVAYSLRRRD